MTDRSDAEQIARNAAMAHHPASGVDLTGLDEFRADLPPLVPMSSAVMADAQAQIAGMDRDPDRHPEDYCHRCDGPNISWFTPGAVWDPVMRPNPGAPWKWQEIICPLCFVELAANGGDSGTWTLLPAKDDGERYTSADERAAVRAQCDRELREAEERVVNVLAGRDIEQIMIRNAVAKLARVEALIATWHKSPDLRTRAHADSLSEAFDGRPRAIEPQLLPHSRACGIRKHEHGAECHSNCPTCGSRAKVTLR